MKHKPNYHILILEAIEALEMLANSPTARINARVWYKHFKRKMRKVEK